VSTYVKQPKADVETCDAAVYNPGESLDDLRRIARLADDHAAVVEVQEWGVLLVRHLEVPDHVRAYTDYDVVEKGQMLVWSERSYVLYVTDPARFQREGWEPA
jgi:hypothetical protein